MANDVVKVRGSILTAEDAEALLKHWQLPEMKDEHKFRHGRTNAIRQPVDLYYLEQERRAQPEPEASAEEAVKPLTMEELEAIRQAAYEEGFAEGKAQGYEAGFAEGKPLGEQQGFAQGQSQGHAQGLQDGQAQIAQLAEQWQQRIDALQQPFRDLDAQAEQAALALVVALAKAVIEVEVRTAPDAILHSFKQGIALLPLNVDVVEIQLHPEDKAIIEQHFGEQTIRDRGWRLTAEANVAQGGCQLTTPHSSIDLTLQQRITQLLDEFLHTANAEIDNAQS